MILGLAALAEITRRKLCREPVRRPAPAYCSALNYSVNSATPAGTREPGAAAGFHQGNGACCEERSATVPLVGDQSAAVAAGL